MAHSFVDVGVDHDLSRVITETFPASFAENDLNTQTVIFQAAFNLDEQIFIKYLDDEQDLIPISSDEDLQNAYNVVLGDYQDTGVLQLRVLNETGKLLARPSLNLDRRVLFENENKKKEKQKPSVSESSQITATETETATETKEIATSVSPQTSETTTQTAGAAAKTTVNATTITTTSLPITTNQMLFTPIQLDWLNKYLESFKDHVINELERPKKAIKNESEIDFLEEDDDDSEDDDNDKEDLLISKVNKLMSLWLRAKHKERRLKMAYVEEHLLSTRAFAATFVKDFNVPDGTVCLPGAHIHKAWLIENTGKLQWSSSRSSSSRTTLETETETENLSIPIVRLINIGGHGGICTLDGRSYVNVKDSPSGQTVSVSVELVAPERSGKYSSEWVLGCAQGNNNNNDDLEEFIHFGPRIWCSIEVEQEQKEDVAKTETPFIFDTSTPVPSTSTSTTPSLISSSSNNNNDNQEKEEENEQRNGEDDDEFVVVPACFDLAKPWNPSSKMSQSVMCPPSNYANDKFEKNNRDTKMDLQAIRASLLKHHHNKKKVEEERRKDESFLNVSNNDDEQHETVVNMSTQTVAASNATEIQVISELTTPNESMIVASSLASNESTTSTASTSTANVEVEEKEKAIEQTNDQTLVVDQLPTTKRHENDDDDENRNDNTTFDKIQQAFSNLGRPASYGNNFDLVSETESSTENKNEKPEKNKVEEVPTQLSGTNSTTKSAAQNLERANQLIYEAASQASQVVMNASSRAASYLPPKVDVDKFRKMMKIIPKDQATQEQQQQEDQSTGMTTASEEKLFSMGFANRALNKKLLAENKDNVQKVVQLLIEQNDNDWFDRR